MKTKILLGLWAILMVFGCKDSFDNFDPDDVVVIPPPEIVEFNASAFVEVVGTDGQLIEGAGITLGTETVTTDEYGVAYLKDVRMGSITYLTVDKEGYFHGSRRFYPSAGKTSYLRVMLMDEVILGQFESGQGGSFTADGGVELDFPADGIMHEDGSSYTGSVTVAAAAIPANDADLSDKMPGDLVGLDENGSYGALASMGMVVVELTSPSGEKLQVRDDADVTMRMDVPAEMIGGAPSSIPMWYFDEVEGIWKEEGLATLNGSEYVAEVGHFTYWNYDAWFDIVKWGASFVFENGAPATQLSVCITILSMDAKKCALTDDEGVVCGMVASGELLLMEVVDPCGEVIYSQEIGPYSDTTMLGPITLPETSITTTSVSGSAVNCDDEPVTEGFARITSGGSIYYIELDENGEYSLDLINCSEADVTVTIVDEGAFKQSLPQTFAFATSIDAGTITACEDITEVILIDIIGVDTTYAFYFPVGYEYSGSTTIYSNDSISGGTGNVYFYLSFEGNEVGTYDALGEIGLPLPMNGGYVSADNPVSVTITYYGDQGDYIIGTISGTMTADPGGGGGDYEFTGSFTALRQ